MSVQCLVEEEAPRHGLSNVLAQAVAELRCRTVRDHVMKVHAFGSLKTGVLVAVLVGLVPESEECGATTLVSARAQPQDRL